jgi:hypothetical protein
MCRWIKKLRVLHIGTIEPTMPPTFRPTALLDWYWLRPQVDCFGSNSRSSHARWGAAIYLAWKVRRLQRTTLPPTNAYAAEVSTEIFREGFRTEEISVGDDRSWTEQQPAEVVSSLCSPNLNR